MNNISISGTIENVYDMTSGIIMVTLKNDEGSFIVFWYKNSFKFDCLHKSYIMVRGKLTYIKVKLSLDKQPKKVIAIEARSIEKYDI